MDGTFLCCIASEIHAPFASVIVPVQELLYLFVQKSYAFVCLGLRVCRGRNIDRSTLSIRNLPREVDKFFMSAL